MSTKLDETQCGPVCQHPGCWYSRRRLVRGTPLCSRKLEQFEDQHEDGSLPMQTVVNLLAEHGDHVDCISSESFALRRVDGHKGYHTCTPKIHRTKEEKHFQPERKFLPPLEAAGGVKASYQEEYFPVDSSDIESAAHNTSRRYVWVPGCKKKDDRQKNRENIASAKSGELRVQDLTTKFDPAVEISPEKIRSGPILKKKSRNEATAQKEIFRDERTGSESRSALFDGRRTMDIIFHFLKHEKNVTDQLAPRITSVRKDATTPMSGNDVSDGPEMLSSLPSKYRQLFEKNANKTSRDKNGKQRKADMKTNKTGISVPNISLGFPEPSGCDKTATTSIVKRSKPENFGLKPVLGDQSTHGKSASSCTKLKTRVQSSEDVLRHNVPVRIKNANADAEERDGGSRGSVSHSAPSFKNSPELCRSVSPRDLQSVAAEDQQFFVVGQAKASFPHRKPAGGRSKATEEGNAKKISKTGHVHTGASMNANDTPTDLSVATTRRGTSESQAVTSAASRLLPETGDAQLPRVSGAGKEEQSESPAPPPPSPEPLRLIVPELQTHPPVSPTHGHLTVLIEAAETESEITISAPPPSNLDDISRINTPSSLASAPRGPILRESINLTALTPRVHHTAEEPSWRSTNPTDQYQRVLDGKHTTDTDQSNNQFNQFDSTLLSGNNNTQSSGRPPQIDADQLTCVSAIGEDHSVLVENGRVTYLTRSDSSISSAREGSIQDETENREVDVAVMEETHHNNESSGVPPCVDEEQLEGEEKETQPSSHVTYKALHADTINAAEGDVSLTMDPLDHFDVSQEELQNELKKEMEKLD